jgi:EAL domain-containing protein (putative c-di-GMP-specific phosphodiesterase class I)
MDDFGTGYSSLAYLVRFPLDIIKIDRSLVAGMESNAQQRMVVSAVVTLGRNLGKDRGGRGVETGPVAAAAGDGVQPVSGLWPVHAAG